MNNLNPFNDAEINEVLKRCKEDQLWFFLDDSLPHKGEPSIWYIKEKFSKNKKTLDAISYCALAVDTIFYMNDVNELKKSEFDYMEKYYPLLKYCYVPFFEEVKLSSNYSKLTKEQKEFLNSFNKECNPCIITLEKEFEYSVPVVVSIRIGKKEWKKEGYLSKPQS